jgi:NAD(P)-dependent dehydrogenase (short-subunit alcohol dehydrogenase family)
MTGGRLANRRAVVIGVGSLIGGACARAFAREGADVIVVDSDSIGASRLASEIRDGGGQASPLGTEEEGEAVIHRVAVACSSRWSALDIVMFCKAAMDPETGAKTLTEWRKVLEVNLLEPIAHIERLLPLLTRSGAASVVLLGSIDGLRANPNLPAYSVSKAGISGLARVMAARYGNQGVRFNCIATGGMAQTAPPVSIPSSNVQLLLDSTPLHRLPAAEEVAQSALFLASTDSSYITGTTLQCDGGRISTTAGTLRSQLAIGP